MDYRRSRAEMETIINFDAAEKLAHIYTADPVYLRKLDKLAEDHPETYRCVWAENGGNAKKYTCPADRIRFAKPTSAARREAGRRVQRQNNV